MPQIPMPTFTYPWALCLLPLGLLFFPQRRTALPFSAISLLPKNVGSRARQARLGAPLLRCLGTAWMVVALAGPRWPDTGSRLPVQSLAIALVVDVSASMAERDFLWQGQRISRLEGVKKVFDEFITAGTDSAPKPRANDLLGLVTFATRPETACPLTLDHAAFLKLLDVQEPKVGANEATTNSGDAIGWALNVLHNAPTTRKIIILLTDGESNVPPPALKPRQASQLAGNLGIPIYAIGAGPEFGPTAGEMGDNIKARQTLQNVAHVSGGTFFDARDAQALKAACAAIDAMERDQVKSYYYRRYFEGYPWFALAGFLCWFAVLVLESTLWRRIP